MKSRSRHNSTKKGFMLFGFLGGFFVTSRNIKKNAETRPSPMRDLIIEQPQMQILEIEKNFALVKNRNTKKFNLKIKYQH